MEQDFQIKPVYSTQAKAIVFAPDENFCKYFGVALQSLIENSQIGDMYDIIVLETDISARNKKLLTQMLPKNFSLRFVNINEYINRECQNLTLKTSAAWSVSTYYRLFIPILMQNYKKVLYCDADIVFNDNLDELFNLEFDGSKIMAVLDTLSPVLQYEKKVSKHFTQELKLEHPEKYFNAGIVMFNIRQINIEEYSQKVADIMANTNLLYFDQDVLNIIFAGKTKYLSSKWNFQWGMYIDSSIDYENMITGEFKKDFLASAEHPVIIHYTTPNKPWNSPREDFAEVFWYYARRSPFYEEILFTILKAHSANKFLLFFKYNTAKILSIITFGKLKEYFIKKRDVLKSKVRNIRKISKL